MTRATKEGAKAVERRVMPSRLASILATETDSERAFVGWEVGEISCVNSGKVEASVSEMLVKWLGG